MGWSAPTAQSSQKAQKECEHVVFQHIQSSLLEVIYRNRSNLETIFRIIDRDHSGKQRRWSLRSIILLGSLYYVQRLFYLRVWVFVLPQSALLPQELLTRPCVFSQT